MFNLAYHLIINFILGFEQTEINWFGGSWHQMSDQEAKAKDLEKSGQSISKSVTYHQPGVINNISSTK